MILLENLLQYETNSPNSLKTWTNLIWTIKLTPVKLSAYLTTTSTNMLHMLCLSALQNNSIWGNCMEHLRLSAYIFDKRKVTFVQGSMYKRWHLPQSDVVLSRLPTHSLIILFCIICRWMWHFHQTIATTMLVQFAFPLPVQKILLSKERNGSFELSVAVSNG